MGNGKRLKEILDEKGKSVRWLAKESTISPTTLYTIIQNDSSIRYDFALKIAYALDIEPSEICSDPLVQPTNKNKYKQNRTIEHEYGYIIFENRIEDYIEESISPYLELLGNKLIPSFDSHIRDYYQLSDEGRKDVDDLIRLLLLTKKDPERAKEIKKVPKW